MWFLCPVLDFDGLSLLILSLGKILSLSCCPFLLGQWRNFCPFVRKVALSHPVGNASLECFRSCYIFKIWINLCLACAIDIFLKFEICPCTREHVLRCTDKYRSPQDLKWLWVQLSSASWLGWLGGFATFYFLTFAEHERILAYQECFVQKWTALPDKHEIASHRPQ